jgi:hypothetical protein
VLRFVRERERELVRRFAVLRGFAAVVERFAAERFGAALLREPVVPVDFARDVAVLARAEVLRALVERFAPVAPDDFGAAPVLSSFVHLPDITRCAASATASAINVPSLVALAMTLLAACEAVSAASSPASRIALRALGLALIAAAAAASPAASISLLIAALANLSTVVPLLFVEEPDELLRADLAIASSPSVRNRHLKRCNGSRMKPEVRGFSNM